jgi:hypothetical protein
VSEHSVSPIASLWRSEGQSPSNIRTRVQHCQQLVFIKTMFTLLFSNQHVRQAYVMQECFFMENRADQTAKRRPTARVFCSRPYSSFETKYAFKTVHCIVSCYLFTPNMCKLYFRWVLNLISDITRKTYI